MRKRKQQAAIDRLTRLKALQRELAEAAGLNPDNLDAASRLKVDNAAWIVSARRSVEASILSGHAGPEHVAYLERLAASLAELLPKAPFTMQIEFVDKHDLCLNCRTPLSEADRAGADEATQRSNDPVSHDDNPPETERISDLPKPAQIEPPSIPPPFPSVEPSKATHTTPFAGCPQWIENPDALGPDISSNGFGRRRFFGDNELG